MDISNRLQAVAALVTKGKRIADIGTDHAYLPVYLLEEHIIPEAIAMDVNKGPLERAAATVERYGYSEKLQLRLSDGLNKLSPGEVDSIVAAGMGGSLMIRILENDPDVVDALSEMILQPQSEIGKVRLWLVQNGWRIVEEDMIFEDGKYYPMMKAVKGVSDSLSDVQQQYGPILLQKKLPVLKQFLEWELTVFEKIEDNLLDAEGQHARQRCIEMREKIDLNRTAYSMF